MVLQFKRQSWNFSYLILVFVLHLSFYEQTTKMAYIHSMAIPQAYHWIFHHFSLGPQNTKRQKRLGSSSLEVLDLSLLLVVLGNAWVFLLARKSGCRQRLPQEPHTYNIIANILKRFKINVPRVPPNFLCVSWYRTKPSGILSNFSKRISTLD